MLCFQAYQGQSQLSYMSYSDKADLGNFCWGNFWSKYTACMQVCTLSCSLQCANCPPPPLPRQDPLNHAEPRCHAALIAASP
jgi:hypothetical protein